MPVICIQGIGERTYFLTHYLAQRRSGSVPGALTMKPRLVIKLMIEL